MLQVQCIWRRLIVSIACGGIVNRFYSVCFFVESVALFITYYVKSAAVPGTAASQSSIALRYSSAELLLAILY